MRSAGALTSTTSRTVGIFSSNFSRGSAGPGRAVKTIAGARTRRDATPQLPSVLHRAGHLDGRDLDAERRPSLARLGVDAQRTPGWTRPGGAVRARASRRPVR